MNYLACLVLDDHRSRPNAVAGEYVAYLQCDQIAATQLAVDGKVANLIGNL